LRLYRAGEQSWCLTATRIFRLVTICHNCGTGMPLRGPMLSLPPVTGCGVMSPVLRKGLVIVAVALLLLIPLAWLRGLVSERTSMRNEALAIVARGWGGRQTLSGPLIAVPVTTTLDDGKTRTSDWYVQPDSLLLDADIKVQDERRKLGVY